MFGHDAGRLFKLLERAVDALEGIASELDLIGRAGVPGTTVESYSISGELVSPSEHQVVYESPNGLEAVCSCGHLMNIASFSVSFATIAGAFAQHINQVREEEMQHGR